MKKITLILLVLFIGNNSFAQWNPDTAVNTLVSDSGADGTQSVVGSNGKTYTVFWKSVPTINYELRLQILDQNGNQELGTDGALISNTIPMSTFTQIWSLTLDKNDNIYIGLTGTNGNAGLAFKLDSSGNNLWTSDGISLGTAYLVRTLPLDSGEVMISWLNGTTFDGEIQKFSGTGTPVWTNPTVIDNGTVSANMYELSNGDIISVYHLLGNGVNSSMYAQRFNGSGLSQWTTPTLLFASGNTTNYNTEYSGSQDGDVVYYAYKLAHNNRFDAYVQRINPDGTLPWGVTGMDFDTNQTNYEQEIKIANITSSQYVWALCRYTDPSQNQVGIYVQKFDKNTGARLLSNNAKAVYAIGSDSAPAGNFNVTALDQPIFITSVSGNNYLEVNLLDENGDFVWPEESKPIATFNASKSRINFNAKPNSEEYILTFVENKGSGNQIFAQNFTDDALLSIENFDNGLEIQYLNPISDILKINSQQPISSITIYNNLGQLISSKNITANTVVEVNSQYWTPGLYYATLVTINGHKKTIKVIKH